MKNVRINETVGAFGRCGFRRRRGDRRRSFGIGFSPILIRVAVGIVPIFYFVGVLVFVEFFLVVVLVVFVVIVVFLVILVVVPAVVGAVIIVIVAAAVNIVVTRSVAAFVFLFRITAAVIAVIVAVVVGHRRVEIALVERQLILLFILLAHINANSG